MVGSRGATAIAGIVLSLAVSAAAWVYFDTLLLFLVVPFVPLLLRRGSGTDEASPARTCPECGFRATDPDVQFCPRHGRRLE